MWVLAKSLAAKENFGRCLTLGSAGSACTDLGTMVLDYCDDFSKILVRLELTAKVSELQ